MYFNDIFSQYFSGYRSSNGCEDVLLHFFSLCKKASDDGDVLVGLAIIIDLSKAFDCLSYKQLICKLRAYIYMD